MRASSQEETRRGVTEVLVTGSMPVVSEADSEASEVAVWAGGLASAAEVAAAVLAGAADLADLDLERGCFSASALALAAI